MPADTARPIYKIADEILKDWRNPYFGAVPYLGAMCYLQDASTAYGMDNGGDIVRYFLSNATTWRGETARRVKAELKRIIA